MCTSLICVQLSCETKTFYLKTVRVVRTIGIPFWQLPFFTISVSYFFLRKTRFKKLNKMFAISSVAGLRGSGFLGQRMAVTVNKATSIYSKTIRDGLLGR